ncbi:NADP-dependent oxidoreductase domain-containing protein [Lentinula guzmanii]|uniref:NADP-dependent oxidoreductase domain-containing protein n=1 Tax=Lentinula guzmanii TaxID=2804957 RepID=A0AA38K046_9AGAR|nr:NADP-dependent oxidoreductase domain-containing protein [Lentinula guzmanii]
MSLTFTLNDGVQIPWLGFGTGTALYTKDSTEAVKAAIQTGITHLDGAQLYRNEESLGQGIKESGVPREQLFVTTKLEETPSAPTIKATLETSLKKLGLNYVDLFLIHSPFVAMKDGKLKEWWKEMEEIKKEGLAKSIGVSNFAVEHLQIILEDATVVPAVNQIELHPYIWDTAARIYDFCQEKGIVVESYGALSSLFRVPGGPVDPVIANAVQRLSKESGTSVSPGQVLMKWLIQKRVVIVTTSSKASRMKEMLATPSLPDLTLEEIAAIETEGSKMHKRFFISRAE